MFKRYIYIEGLTSLTNSDGKFSINIFGRVKDVYAEDIPTRKDEEGNLIVNVKSWDGVRDYRVIDLVAIHFKDLYIPKENYNDVIAFPMDGDKTNVHAKNIGYRFKNKIEVKEFPNFYHIPGFTKYAINEKGKVINLVKKQQINWHVTKSDKKTNTKGGYFVGHYNSSSLKCTFSRHRALCLTFKEYPDTVDELVVNHINGIPGNDFLDNLEWNTRGQNNTHAYVNNLKQQNKSVLSRDVLTGEVREYYSICECARALGYPTNETIRNRLVNCAFGTVFSDGKQFKYTEDQRDWVIPDDPQQAIAKATLEVPVVVKNCLTNTVSVFKSMTEASLFTGIKIGTIGFRLAKKDKSPLFGYQVKRLDDDEIFPIFTHEEHLESLTPCSFKVVCRNLLTGEYREYKSVNSAAKNLGNLNIPILLKKGNQPILPSGWQVKFDNADWEKIDDVEETIYKLNKTMMAREEMSGKVIIAESARKMAEVLNLDPKSIRIAAYSRGNALYHGYRFRLGVSVDPWPIS